MLAPHCKDRPSTAITLSQTVSLEGVVGHAHEVRPRASFLVDDELRVAVLEGRLPFFLEITNAANESLDGVRRSSHLISPWRMKSAFELTNPWDLLPRGKTEPHRGSEADANGLGIALSGCSRSRRRHLACAE